jgi:hypothetical protein
LSDVSNLILLKTTLEHVSGVVQSQKHALRGRIQRAQSGDIILIAEMQKKGPAIVKFGMFFVSQYPDTANEAEKIWGRRWPFLIQGTGGQWLTNPFAPALIIPDGPYGQGGTLVYVPTAHSRAFASEGRLSPLLS